MRLSEDPLARRTLTNAWSGRESQGAALCAPELLCAHSARPESADGHSSSSLERMETESSGLTMTDRLSWAGLILLIVLWTFAGLTAFLYLQEHYLGGTATTDSGQWTQVAYALGLTAVGTALGGISTRSICRRFASVRTQKRWLNTLTEMLDEPYVKRRGRVVAFLIWALVPDRDAL